MCITNTMWIWLHHNDKMSLNTRCVDFQSDSTVFIHISIFETRHFSLCSLLLWLVFTTGRCYRTRNDFWALHLLTHFSLPFLCPPLRQVTCWASSTPLQRKSSATKAPTSSSSAGVSWRPLIGWRPPSRTERRAGRLTPRNLAALTNSYIISSNLRSQLLW